MLKFLRIGALVSSIFYVRKSWTNGCWRTLDVRCRRCVFSLEGWTNFVWFLKNLFTPNLLEKILILWCFFFQGRILSRQKLQIICQLFSCDSWNDSNNTCNERRLLHSALVTLSLSRETVVDFSDFIGEFLGFSSYRKKGEWALDFLILKRKIKVFKVLLRKGTPPSYF